MAFAKGSLEVFKFTVYLSVPVGAYMFFMEQERVKRFVDRFSPAKRTNPELLNVIPEDIEERLRRGEFPEDIAAKMESDRRSALERKQARLRQLQQQHELHQQLKLRDAGQESSSGRPASS